jgi:gliding motility-associated-like protein
MDSASVLTDTVSICAGSTYTLPWGVVVTAAGTYTDTVRHRTSGCDSLVRIIQVKTLSAATENSTVSFCAGSTYTLPWNVTVSAPGIYRDTLHNSAGCDSVIRVIDLRTNAATTESFTANICPGQTYSLPWGIMVSSPGVYTDTIHGQAGCDSVIRKVDLFVGTTLRDTTDAGICKGQNYTLPSGTIVQAAGVYKDTLRSSGGCDSVIHVIRLSEKQTTTVTTGIAICPGGSYSLPWGGTVTTPGVYRDTIPYRDGCDSLIRVVDLSVDTTVGKQTTAASICPGQPFTLPWGAVVTAPGQYSDTVRSQGGCDSLIQVVELTSPTLSTQTINASICTGESFTLPWGNIVSTAGTYSDTLKTTGGCDSLVQMVNLRISSPPVLSLSKSNDIDCMTGTARLSASGGAKYVWSPAASLTNPNSADPVASPSTSTMYYVQASSPEGCIAVDSILVKVSPGGVENGYWVPNAFTPNNDGKNDCFGIKHWGAVSHLNFMIYNRWGEVVFQTSDASRCWDGTFKGASLPTGTFVYLIDAETLCGQVKRKGTVTLIR